MDIKVVQARFKTADYDFNFKSVNAALKSSDAELFIFAPADISDLGGKDLCYDEKCAFNQAEFYQKLALENPDKKVLIGDVLLKNGEVFETEDGFFDIDGFKIYVADTFIQDVECDLYVLAKNRYYAMNTYRDFVESIDTTTNFIYINAIAMADENIYAGASFAKNKNNELVMQMPLCEEFSQNVDFNSPIEFREELKESELLKVTTFALREYCENTGFKKVILGLSGGIDSALTAALAAKAIGAENVLGILLPSMFSSSGSIDDSLKLAQNLGIKTEKHPIIPMFDLFMDKVAHETVDTSGKEHLAVENLQARLRALILMYFSNRDNRLLLSTGNKSEAAMGYGTLYGDMAGGLNVICDLTKTNVYALSNFINKDGEIIPQEIIDKAPSAELRPGQKDQDSLPDYAVLDDIIEMYLEEGKSVDEISEKYDRNLVETTVRKIYRAEFKRRQSCLGVRLTERSFTNGIKLPIVQKCY